jgi:hypothetical protein
MAYAITDKPNTEAPSADYPFGNIKDKTISTSGTPVNKLVYTDIHQFFAKLMDYAGVTPNGLPDNEYSGWQLMEALMELSGGMKTKVIEIGAWDMDADDSVLISHGLTFGHIRSVEAYILDDAGTNLSKIERIDGAGDSSGYVTAAAQIEVNRVVGRFFDNTSYNDTGVNRGYVIIKHVDAL